MCVCIQVCHEQTLQWNTGDSGRLNLVSNFDFHYRSFSMNLDAIVQDKYIYTVKTPDADFRTYNRMPQDQTVHGAENVSCLWAA
jgi:hypothetical protein